MNKLETMETEEVELGAPAFSEMDLALRFVTRHADELRYVDAWKRWYQYDGKIWTHDETRKTFSLSQSLCREASWEVNKKGSARKAIASAKTRAAVVSLAGEDRRLAATIDQWDKNIWDLNTPEGVVNLQTGKKRNHRADDYMTKMTSVAPNTDCLTPLWSNFLDKVTGKDKELQNYLRRMSGYSLTGETREHALFFPYGTGRNGKGVFTNTVTGVMGEYHCAAPIETFTESNVDKHPTELAMLRGARLVTSTETEEGRRWAEARIKMLTGGDPVSARFMRQDFFKYKPQFKLMIQGNHKPGLRSVDEAIKARFNLIPFAVTIPEAERDKELGNKLVAEYPGILAWMIKGCLEWQEIGLSPPQAVKDATDHYLAEEDVFNLWLEDCCVKDPNYTTLVGSLFEQWKTWAELHGEYVGSCKRFSQRLEANKFEKCSTHAGRSYRGLSIYKDGDVNSGKKIWDHM